MNKNHPDKTNGKTRSSKWAKVRKDFLAKNPTCAVCGGTKKLEVHHKLPFHLDSSAELEEDNLITLCESDKGGMNCHLSIGHLSDFKSYNPSVVEDAKMWHDKIINRPYVRQSDGYSLDDGYGQ